eukprot:scaffold120333_cov36-Phaeocystis_antarctica.AAC.1
MSYQHRAPPRVRPVLVAASCFTMVTPRCPLTKMAPGDRDTPARPARPPRPPRPAPRKARPPRAPPIPAVPFCCASCAPDALRASSDSGCSGVSWLPGMHTSAPLVLLT